MKQIYGPNIKMRGRGAEWRENEDFKRKCVLRKIGQCAAIVAFVNGGIEIGGDRHFTTKSSDLYWTCNSRQSSTLFNRKMSSDISMVDCVKNDGKGFQTMANTADLRQFDMEQLEKDEQARDTEMVENPEGWYRTMDGQDAGSDKVVLEDGNKRGKELK